MRIKGQRREWNVNVTEYGATQIKHSTDISPDLIGTRTFCELILLDSCELFLRVRGFRMNVIGGSIIRRGNHSSTLEPYTPCAYACKT